MAVYAIGDVQGCYRELTVLLETLSFDPGRDRLWFTGDLVNRGPASLEVLRFVKGLGDRAVTVLGNHDLHLLAVAGGHERARPKDTFDDVLTAPDRDELLTWLRHRPLLHREEAFADVMVHAGLPPQWDMMMAAACAAEVETALRVDHEAFLANMYGDRPSVWVPGLCGWDRLRFITNCFTRLRYCDAAGRIDLDAKGPPGSQPPGYMPWFEAPGRRTAGRPVIFGHWSTLGVRSGGDVFALDGGCVWGGSLTALRMDGERTPVAVPCRGACRPG